MTAVRRRRAWSCPPRDRGLGRSWPTPARSASSTLVAAWAPCRPCGRGRRPAQRPSTARRTSSTIWPAGQLDDEDAARAAARRARVPPRGTATALIGRNSPTADALLAGALDGRAGDPGRRAVGDDHQLGVVELLARPAHLALGDRAVLGLEVVGCAPPAPPGCRWSELDDARRAPVGPGRAPTRAAARAASGKSGTTGSMAWPMIAVGQEHHRGPVPLGELEARRRRGRPPRRSRRARAPAPGSRRGRGPWSPGSSRSATARCCRGPGPPRITLTSTIGALRAGHVAHRLGHEADPRARRGDQDAGAGGRRAEGHVDRAQLALGLDEDPAELRHAPRHPLQQLRLGRDGVAEVGVAAGLDGGLGDRLVALHQDAGGPRRRGLGAGGGPDRPCGRSARTAGPSSPPPFGRRIDGEDGVGTDARTEGAARAALAASISRMGW